MAIILHISDLHIVDGPAWNNMRAILLDEVEKKVSGLDDGEKLIIITGDFHNFTDENYKKAQYFLNELFNKMKINPRKDVFVVPGNHDVANDNIMNKLFESDSDWKMRQEAAVTNLKQGKQEYLKWRYESFKMYCDFTKKMNIYSQQDEYLPSKVHVRNWRGKLNILHLNTVLVADGSEKRNQKVDTYAATSDDIWKEKFKLTTPTIAIGHNSFYDLNEEDQKYLSSVFYRKEVSAYLCGDQHRINRDSKEQMIRLNSGYNNISEIPNIVCMKSAADQFDFYSEFGFYWHEWNEETDLVELNGRIWKRNEDQTEFKSIGEKGYYYMKRKNENKEVIIKKINFPSIPITKDIQIVKNKYFNYLSKELGVMQFDGIPMDKKIVKVKIELENIFIPLEFCKVEEDDFISYYRYTIGDILKSNKKVAILAKPGGGKSTLIRRIALAYAFDDRRIMVNDDLPNEEWFPVYIRCRDLGENVQKSIKENIYSIINRAEFYQYKKEFIKLIEDCINKDKLLLLIDGLDEISNEQDRTRFVNQLYTFANEYPETHMIITSREPGFRVVARKIDEYCKKFIIADLNEDQIWELSENWHMAFLDNPIQASEESERVSNIILQDPKMTSLACNPLILTTMLFVKSWLGYLPTKKCQLYQEMIRLLLVSWNVVGHIKMDLDEAEPQLAFVAYEMIKSGKQTIQRSDLIRIINKARVSLPWILGYTKISPSEFINLVEERSNIIIKKGLERDETGNFVSYYEFSHLNFQEFLAAKAIVENWLPKENQNKLSMLSNLEKTIYDTKWREIIPLVAALLKQQATPLIEYLMVACKKESLVDLRGDEMKRKSIATYHLANCIVAEVPMIPETLKKAILLIIIQKDLISEQMTDKEMDVFTNIYYSEKYGKILKSVVEEHLFEKKELIGIYELMGIWYNIYTIEKGKPNIEYILSLLKSDKSKNRVAGAILIERWLYEYISVSLESQEIQINNIFLLIMNLLNSTDVKECFIASWCIASAECYCEDIIPYIYLSKIVERLINLWCDFIEFYEIRLQFSWTLSVVCKPNIKIKLSKKTLDRFITCILYGKIGIYKNEMEILLKTLEKVSIKII